MIENIRSFSKKQLVCVILKFNLQIPIEKAEKFVYNQFIIFSKMGKLVLKGKSMSLLEKIFGSHSDHAIKKLIKTVDEIEALAPKYKAMSETELRGMTAVLKDRLENG